ncbi:uncharacterized protein LOC130715190 [Lotus japonicus]|uniref:uncharacterized protein LOC130715190 n=1 Tax=Lotus japonicus TaxID=34305 RepID=UPI0025853A70|nr:uncharacterized protein LOC130715190 [Lotus japonicus]
MSLSLKFEIDVLSHRFDVIRMIALKAKICEIALPDIIPMSPSKVKTRGKIKGVARRSTKHDSSILENFSASMNSVRNSISIVSSTNDPTKAPKHTKDKSTKVIPYIDQFPSEMRCYIDDIVDVISDGNCGYRAVAASLGMGQENWAQVRIHMINELQQFQGDYVSLFGSIDRVKHLIDALNITTGKFVTKEKWMTIPDMGLWDT